MNAPDKIFLHKVRDEESSGYHKMWFESRGRLVPSEEYIRKDALLELLIEKRKAITECSASTERRVAALSVIDFLTDKIESL